MTSMYVFYEGLSQQTRKAYEKYTSPSRTPDDMLDFYLHYLRDVVPFGITVNHVPANKNLEPIISQNSREEIQLVTNLSGKIFMTGLISLERHFSLLEPIAADEAYTHWLDGDFVDRNWRFFTGIDRVRFCRGSQDAEWEIVDEFWPMSNPDQVAEYLQEEYNRLEQR